MNEEELRKEAEKYVRQNYCEMCVLADDCKSGCVDCFTVQAYLASATSREKRIAVLEAQIEKMKCLDEEIIKALKESEDCAWLLCHNGKAKYIYLQSAIDIVHDKFEELREK